MELHLLKTWEKCNATTFDAYPTLINSEHICLHKIPMSKNRMKQNDKNLSELELKSFWYKLHENNICTKMDLIIYFSILNYL
jgi:hypothetical protein